MTIYTNHDSDEQDISEDDYEHNYVSKKVKTTQRVNEHSNVAAQLRGRKITCHVVMADIKPKLPFKFL